MLLFDVHPFKIIIEINAQVLNVGGWIEESKLD
jgi:hypothetical protein